MAEEQKEKYANFLNKVSEILGLNRPVDILRLCAVTDEYFQPIEKRIAELEEKISVLLSCKNCPENKDGLICQKEYEGKCLAQKIQYIKELKEENAKLREKLGDVQMQKAGRPKWHKVADGDLPSEEGGWVCNQNGLPCYFEWGTEQWLDCEGTQIRTTEWCHMPHKE